MRPSTASCPSTRSPNCRARGRREHDCLESASASIKCGPRSSTSSSSPHLDVELRLGDDGFWSAGGHGSEGGPSGQAGHRYRRRRQLPDEHSGTGHLFCEKLPGEGALAKNQHLGMVVQWEDQFFKGNRAHTYLGPIDNPEATGEGGRPRPAGAVPISWASPRLRRRTGT